MKNMYPKFNPFMMGLMGGAQNFLAGIGNYFDEQRKHQNKLDEISAKYTAMGSANAAKAENQKLMSALKLEAGQRSYNVDTTDENGNPVRVSYRNTYDPNTQSYAPHEIGRVPLSALQKNGAPVTRNFGDQVKQWNPQTQSWDTVGSNANNSVSQREQQRDAKIDARENQRDERAKAERLDSAVQKDMAAFDKADPTTQAQMLKAAGVADKVNDPNAVRNKTWMPSSLGGETEHDPDKMIANPDLRQQYEDAITAKHAKRLGIAVPSDSGTPAPGAPSSPSNPPNGNAPPSGQSSQPTFDAQGRQIKYDKQGNPFVKGPDGKPVPADSAPPLAMDAAAGQSQDATASVAPISGDNSGPDSDSSDDNAPDSPGLMAGTESQPSDDSDQSDDEEDDQQQPQGLMA